MSRIALVLAMGFAATAAVAHDGRGAQSAVLDRTLVCTTGLQAGVHEIDLSVQSGVPSSSRRKRWAHVASLELTTPGIATPGPEQWFLAAVSAGRSETGGGGTVSIAGSRCTPYRTPIPLTRTGLTPRDARAIGDAYECAVPPRLVVRVRGVFGSRAQLRRNRFGYLTALGGIAREARLAVRTFTGKPLVYAMVDDSGRARLFTARGCVAE